MGITSEKIASRILNGDSDAAWLLIREANARRTSESFSELIEELLRRLRDGQNVGSV